jgi:hypothetical protein
MPDCEFYRNPAGFLAASAPGPEPTPAPDMISHPPHYNSHPSGVESIEITRHFTYNIGNVIAYCWRHLNKGDPLNDLRKARWHLDDEIKRLEQERK